MFDAKLDASAIKKRYEWQAYRKLDSKETELKEHEIIKKYNAKFGGHFAKVIKINKINYILIYFNNENDLLKAIYNSTMEEDDINRGLKIKSQDEDAKSDILSAIPRTEEEHAELDALNNNFSNRLNEITKISDLPKKKEKNTEEKDDVNKNKNA
ncbi:hypothetical protein RhiirA4_480687 [Rhizophagus irregularis]|uniref:Uncharacterized protein n=1 Tax=Rhizophagus irregularis TaxID=588596 RepID=A0A2I1HIC9_9GLOM|nr:hypothetical protein RhiirA4_480687 [Rhizophagus irregularis]